MDNEKAYNENKYITSEWIFNHGGTSENVKLFKTYFPKGKAEPYKLLDTLIEKGQTEHIRKFLTFIPSRGDKFYIRENVNSKVYIYLDDLYSDKDLKIENSGILLVSGSLYVNGSLNLDNSTVIVGERTVVDSISVKNNSIFDGYILADDYLML